MVPRVRDTLRKSLREREDNKAIRSTTKQSKEEDNPERKKKILRRWKEDSQLQDSEIGGRWSQDRLAGGW